MVELRALGDDALTVALDELPASLAARAEALRALGLFEEVVPGLSSLTVSFDPLRLPREEAMSRLSEALSRPAPTQGTDPRHHRLAIRYGGEAGPDLEAVAQTLRLSEDEVVARHGAATHKVALIGFMPGFAYLDGAGNLPAARLSRPRPRVAAGSVGLAGGRTGLYALQSPGGWPLIGRVSVPLWGEDGPLLRAGDTVSFEAS